MSAFLERESKQEKTKKRKERKECTVSLWLGYLRCYYIPLFWPEKVPGLCLSRLFYILCDESNGGLEVKGSN